MAKLLDGDNLSVNGATITGSISTTTLTVTGVASGFIDVGCILTGSGITAGTRIVSYLSGTGNTGTYIVDTSQTASSTTITLAGEITIDTSTKVFTLNAGTTFGDLVAKDGVTLQALYSKFIKLWEYAYYNKYPFPMYVIDAKSGQFQFGTDGGKYNGWKPVDDTTRQMLRDGGWSEYLTGVYDGSGNLTSGGTLARQYVGIVSLGDVNTGAQLYYQRASGGTAYNFTFADEVNEGIQVFGDATNGNYDTRSYFKAYVREQGKKYKSSTLADTGQSGTGAYTVNVLLSNETDLDITVADNVLAPGSTLAGAATYSGITVAYYSTGQQRDINSPSDNYLFSTIVAGNGATLQQIYTKVQYLLRQNTDINTGGDAGVKTGKIQDDLMYFVGPDLYCKQGVFIDNIDPNYINNVYFIDNGGTPRQYNYASAGQLQFNSFLTSGSTGYYRMYITDSVTGADDYGTATAITLNDKDGNPISGTITSSTINFTFAYDTNTQGGRSVFTSPGGDVNVTIVAGNKGVAKPVVATGKITRSKGIVIGLVAEQDRAYVA